MLFDLFWNRWLDVGLRQCAGAVGGFDRWLLLSLRICVLLAFIWSCCNTMFSLSDSIGSFASSTVERMALFFCCARWTFIFICCSVGTITKSTMKWKNLFWGCTRWTCICSSMGSCTRSCDGLGGLQRKFSWFCWQPNVRLACWSHSWYKAV